MRSSILNIQLTLGYVIKKQGYQPNASFLVQSQWGAYCD